MEWFAEWFDSPYYHILYQHRDYTEAEFFMTNLVRHLQIVPNQCVLDLACGKGRHAIFLSNQGLDVTGIDLSIQSIEYARTFEKENLSFFTQDMRKPFRINYFDYVFNLFTSFGYFENQRDELHTIAAIRQNLRPNGILVMDFFNSQKIIENLVAEEYKTLSGIHFHIKRSFENGFLLKNIEFEDKGKKYHFTEKVRSLTLSDFQNLFAKNEMQILELFGNYALDAFDINRSDRLILIVKR